MEASSAKPEAEQGGPLAGKQDRGSIRRADGKRTASTRSSLPRLAFDAWSEISARVQAANRCAFFLDFDGTLVNIRKHPDDVRAPLRVKRILESLVSHSNAFVAVVSGRRVRNLRSLLAVDGLHYFGLHGGERGGETLALGRTAKTALDRARRAARLHLRNLPGVWTENKGLTFSVHYRNAGAVAERLAKAALTKLLEPWGDALQVLNGRRVWEVLPREVPGKASVVEGVLASSPARTVAIYVGDDDTDEPGFAILKNHITVRVGSAHDTRARYWLPGPADVSRFLSRLERELR